MRGGPLSARSRLIPPFYFAPTEEGAIALSGPRCTSSIGLCRRYSGSYRPESSISDTGRHNLEVGIIEIAHKPKVADRGLPPGYGPRQGRSVLKTSG
jgi:hypothetical protein